MLYEEKVADILAHADDYHSRYYRDLIFNGPSLYFHQQALVKCPSDDLKPQPECIYAVLALWEMHRMGKGGPKMVDFEIFEESIASIIKEIEIASHIEVNHVSEEDWDALEHVFRGIKVMATGTSLVGNSKVMAHLLPNIVAPIDRRFTLSFLHSNTDIINDIDAEWNTMQSIIRHFFIPIAQDAEFRRKAHGRIKDEDRYPWDTSVLKVIDNLVIGAMMKA